MSQIMELVWLAPDIQQEILEFPPNGGAVSDQRAGGTTNRGSFGLGRAAGPVA